MTQDVPTIKSNKRTIEAGIGYITYDSDNLLLLEVMEALAKKIKTDGANRTLDLLTQKTNKQ